MASRQGNYYRVQISRKGVKVDKLFKTRKEARDFEEKVRIEIDNGTYQDEETFNFLIPTVKVMLADYFDLILKPKNTHFVSYKATRKNQEYKLKRQIPDVMIKLGMEAYHSDYVILNGYTIDSERIPFGAFRIDTVDRHIIDRYIEARREEGLQEGSIQTELSYIKPAFSYTKKMYPSFKSDNIEIKNPFDDFVKGELPKHSPARKIVISEANLDIIYERFSKKRNQQYLLAFLICVETGIRKSECLSIQYQHIDFEKSTIYIPITKNGRDRKVTISKETLDLIPRGINEGKLFSVSVSALNMTWKQVTKDLQEDGKGIVWHSLKNTAISNYINKQRGYSAIQVANKFAIRTDYIERNLPNNKIDEIIIKAKAGIPLTDEEISIMIGGHSSVEMTAHYYNDK